jgi:hypothetical protein
VCVCVCVCVCGVQNQRAKHSGGGPPRDCDFSADHLSSMTDRNEVRCPQLEPQRGHPLLLSLTAASRRHPVQWSFVNGDKADLNPLTTSSTDKPRQKGWHWDGNWGFKWNWEYAAGWNDTWARKPDEKTRVRRSEYGCTCSVQCHFSAARYWWLALAIRRGSTTWVNLCLLLTHWLGW